MIIKIKFITRGFLPVLLALLLPNVTNAQEILKRKNIDSLTATELAAYQHALQVMNDKSVKNPYDQEGYAWQAWVHNRSYVSIPSTPPRPISPNESYTDYYKYIVGQRFQDGKNGYPGECEHGKDLFLFWHRAEFYYFEKVLQNADPNGTITDSKGHKGPSTAKVTIPYWNFTNPASGAGKRFPKAFEDTGSILYHPGRASGVPTYKYTSKDFIQNTMNNKWLVFGGYPNATGGGSSASGGFGVFELTVHNPMHAQYCGGDMGDNSTAAYDPIFYSFHAYLDFVFDEWLRINNMVATGSNPHDTISSLNYHLRGELPAKYNVKNFDPGKGNRPTMSKCSLYLDHRTLGYEYQVQPGDHYGPRTAGIKKLLDNTGKPIVFGKSNLSEAATLTANTFLAPADKEGIVEEEGAVAANKMISKNGYFNFQTKVNTSFKVDVYIHPKNVKTVITDEAFRNKYLVTTVSNWHLTHEMEGAASDGGTKLNIYIAHELADLRKNSKAEDWVISTNLTQN